MALLYTDYFARRYVTSAFSWVFIFTLIIWACVILLPIVLAESTFGFWRRVDMTTLQPKVNYINEFYAIA